MKYAILTALLLGACHSSSPAPATGDSRYLFVWAGDADRQQSDFLAVLDVDPRSPTYASVVATSPVGVQGTRPHHTEHEMPASGILWVNGFDSGQTFRFDLRDPLRPRLLGAFGDVAGYSHPHSYLRLPNGNVLATFQMRSGHATGGLVELDADGRVIRSVSAVSPLDSGIRPYSAAIVPALDRIVTTSTDMHLQARSTALQIWRLSDLRLLQTIQLPPGSRGDENRMTAEPRVLADGRTVMVNTFTCGLYLLRGLESDTVSAQWVRSTPFSEPPFCALPVILGNYWIYADGPARAVVSLDISDPAHPREAGRLELGPTSPPHWLALEPNGERIVITGYQGMSSQVLLARVNRATGALSRDTMINLDREQWPHGGSGRALPHGAVFSR